MKKSVIISIVVFVLIILLLIFNPYIGGYLDNKRNLEDVNLIPRYEKITSMMKTSLPEVPESSKILDVTLFYTPHATCYLDSRASIANYLENISYDEFVGYSRPFEFKYLGENGEIRSGIGGGEQTVEAFYNLGYKAYNGNTAGRFAPAIFMRHETADDSYIFFKTQEDAFDFVKKLISSGVPVAIIFKGDFGLIAGYNETHVFIQPYKDPETGMYISPIKSYPLFNEEAASSKEYQALTKKQFFDFWKTGENSFTWFEKINERKTKEEMFEINRQDAINAAENSRKFAKNPIMGSYTSDGDGTIFTAAGSRYLKRQNYDELANKYMEIAGWYNERATGNKFISYSEIAKLYEEAAKLW